MNRRDFIKYLLATPIAAELDVEKLLWVPDKKIFIPPITQYVYGIPYHASMASTGQWLGIPRGNAYPELIELIRRIEGAKK